MLDIFEFAAFVTDRLKIEGRGARARIKVIYIHFGSGERLNVTSRFIFEQSDGLIVRMDEYHDDACIEANGRLRSAVPPA